MYTKNYLKSRNDFMDTFNPFSLGNLNAEIFTGPEGVFVPKVDISETKESYDVHVALPGFKKDEIQVKIENQVLTISGERKKVTEENRTYHRIETKYGMFERSFRLGEKANTEKIDATFENGVLALTIPKKEKELAKVNTIEVK